MSESRIRIRRAGVVEAEAIAAVHVAAWRETYAGLMAAEMLVGLSVDERSARWRCILGEPDPAIGTTTFVACAPGDSVVGFGSCGQQRSQELADAASAGSSRRSTSSVPPSTVASGAR